jgi:ribosome-binding factor A
LHFFHDQSIERGIEMSRLIDRALQSAAPENPKEEL